MPGTAVGSILNDHAERGEAVTDGVAGGPILVRPGLVADVHERVHQCCPGDSHEVVRGSECLEPGRDLLESPDRLGEPQYADDLAGLLDQLELPRVTVGGLAYGARTAARFALRYPDRVERLALFDVSLAQPVDQALQKLGNQEAKALRDAAGLSSPKVERSWFEHDDSKEAMRSLTAHRDQPDPTEELASLDVPTLIACGRQDVNLPEAERIAALVPDARLEIIEMAGHGSHLSRPDVVAQLLIDFAAR